VKSKQFAIQLTDLPFYVLHCSLRLQAYISLKLYTIKKSEVQHLRKAIDDSFQVFWATLSWCFFFWQLQVFQRLLCHRDNYSVHQQVKISQQAFCQKPNDGDVMYFANIVTVELCWIVNWLRVWW